MQLVYQLINGIHMGSIYALIAIGYSMVYGIVKLINFAHGDIIMVGSYVVWYCMVAGGMPFWLAIPITMAACAVLGVVIEAVAYRPLRKVARISLLITAIGISFLLQNTALMVFTATPKMFPNFIPGGIPLGTRQLSMTTIVTVAASLGLMLLLTFFINNTRSGKAMRAVSEDREAAQLMGVNINRTISMTFAIGSALAGIAAVLFCCSYTQISPTMGGMMGLKAFIAAVLGGIGSLPGAMLGGFLIGLAESLTIGYISSSFADTIVFSILILVLLLKPSGLMGKNVTEKV